MLNPLNLFKKIIKSSNQKELEKIEKILKKVNSNESKIAQFSDNMFPEKTQQLIKQLNEGKKLDDILPEAFSLVREASKRVTRERHFDVQIVGGVVLHQNKIAEMKTGEGKTLTIVLAAYLNALKKKWSTYSYC
tara:strand:+ start:120 stop:521 length:402 start_codon:yes stop_codon:yes gene_type:complete